jgi:hypothetical protein
MGAIDYSTNVARIDPPMDTPVRERIEPGLPRPFERSLPDASEPAAPNDVSPAIQNT